MGLNEQMGAVDQLMRRPQDLAALLGGGDDVAGIVSTVDGERAQAVHAVFAELIAARWWQPRFPATVAALRHFLGEGYASWLVGQPCFLEAEGEDLRGSALGRGVLSAIGASDLPEGARELPEWLPELCGYEYLLAVGLPRRAAGEEVDAALEAELLPLASWQEGGRLTRRVLVAPFTWPIAELQEEPHDAEPDPHLRLLWLDEGAASEVEAPHLAGDVLELLAGGAEDSTVLAVDEECAAALDWFRELGLLG
jgi:hypothetical protein